MKRKPRGVTEETGLTVSIKDGRLLVSFPHPVQWFALDLPHAQGLADLMQRQCRRMRAMRYRWWSWRRWVKPKKPGPERVIQ